MAAVHSITLTVCGAVEYAWQHPYVCRFTRERLASIKSARGLGHPYSVKRKLVELHEMLHVLPWSHFPLTVTYTSQGAVRSQDGLYSAGGP
ncbi:hypothetical protein PINS_up022391 [Pythium insidiosum]|nr:hypothetical protein PINS_up022391 [Pythium insidiosum]